MQDSHSDRGLLYPSDLDICHRVYEQVRHQRGFDFNSPAAETLASYVLFSYQNGTTDEAKLLTAARRKLIAIDTDDGPYDVDVFAKKHRLTVKSASVILHMNGPSRRACDAAARSFVAALKAEVKC